MAKAKQSAEELAAAALDPKQEDAVAQAIALLTPEEAQHFVGLLEKSIRRRRLQLMGYLLSLVVLIGGMFGAMLYVGSTPPGTFVAWIFFLPILAVALIFYVFGRWSSRIK